MEKDLVLSHLRQDPVLVPLIESLPFPVFSKTGCVYRELVRAILAQQLSVKAAKTITERLYAQYGGEVPPPAVLAAADPVELRRAGVSKQKASYLKAVGAWFAERQMKADDWAALSDEEAIELLTQIKGVGRWTAEMVLIFTLQRPDVFPADDLGVQMAMQRLYRLEAWEGRALRKHMQAIAEKWRPWRSVATRYLWLWKDLNL